MPTPRRSILYLPASRDSAVAKARTLDCDCVILDLEDAVAPDQKVAARAKAVAAIRAGDWGHREVLVRANGINTEWAPADFAAAREAGAAAVVVPKVDSAAEAVEAVRMAGGVPVWAMIETPRAVIEVAAIAATPGIAALVAGFADLSKDLGLRPDAARTPLHYSMSAIVIAARAAGILAFDGVFTDIRDEAGLRTEARQARMFGFDGKTLIHPSQVDVVNAVFAATPEEIAAATGLLAAYEAAVAEGRGVTTYDGKLVEVLHAAAARQLLATANARARR
ncbi:CoA ester lyase [Sphingosinicellaceae bacterium]|nr:CoA ester lyase [Sphingosinicellaceae bacterium]